MTTDSKALAAYKEEIAKELANVSSTLTTGGGDIIKCKMKTFTLPDGTNSQDPIQVVVVAYSNNNAYFSTPYNQNNPTPPDCKAKGSVIEDLKPDASSTDAQTDGLCKDCANNQWGSSPNGGNGKACTQSVMLAVVPSTADADTAPMLFKVPATTMKAWGNYVLKLAGMGITTTQMITEISFNPAVDYNNFLFRAIEPVKDLGVFMGLKAEANAILK